MFTATAAFQPQPVWAQTSGRPVNVNTADLATLETLPGVGPTVAQRIIDGRPYHSMSDLEKVKGLGKAKADALAGQITFDSTSAATKAKSTKGTPSASSAKPSTTANGRVNVNTDGLAALETLPGVGAATAQKIIDGRPYSSLTDLERVKGLNATKVEAMKDQITFGSTSASKPRKSKSSTPAATPSESTGNQSAPAATTRSPSENTLPATGRASSSKVAPGEKININTADAEELDKLYGIGPSKAQAIIDYRNEHGNFQSIEDIMKVNGIKEGEFGKIRDNITVR
jgi:competence protein ComEA